MKVAILLATYNGEDYLLEQLESIDRQTYSDFVCYIHDDGSTDSTVDIIDSWVSGHDEKYIKLDYKKSGSAKDNFFSLLKNVDADYYLFADQDDVWLEEKVEKQINKILEVENRIGTPTVVYSDMFVTDDKLNVITNSFIEYIGRDINRNKLEQVMIDNPAAGCTMIINKSMKDKALSYKNSKEILMHDQWILAIAASLGLVGVIDEPLVYYRQHYDNEMGAKTESVKEKVVRNVRNVASLEFVKNKKTFHEIERNLAKQLLYVKGIPSGKRQFLMDLVAIQNKTKVERMRFYRKHGMDRKNHSLWMRLWV